MNNWSSGYVTEVGYTHGYYREHSPLHIEFALLQAGYSPPHIQMGCELGFGQGVTINMHASSQSVQWWGNDFNPAQAGFAQDLAKRADNHAELDDAAFAQFCTRSDLPEFDFIVLHGIWCWISDADRQVIINFIHNKLKVGGVLYINYNTQPGWASATPMRDLIYDFVKTMTPSGMGITQRIDAAMQFTEKLFATNPAYIKANPTILERLKNLKQQDRIYLAHEYFNQNWLPMSFSDMNNWLSQAKLSYVTSANLMQAFEIKGMTTEQQALLQTIEDPIFRETVRDLIVNETFRRDLWVKGPRLLSPFERVEQLRQKRVCLFTNRQEVSFKFPGNMGEVSLQESIYMPIVEALADHQPKSIAQIEAIISGKDISLSQLLQAIQVFVGNGTFSLVQDPQLASKIKKRTEKLNDSIKERSRSHNGIQFLASPLIGGGVPVSRFGQLFILALESGKKSPEEWAAYVLQYLQMQGQKIVKEGKTLETAEENLKELIDQAKTFEIKQLPILKSLQIV
jgi:SAM-dependent methyltransferase/methyltransferase-like protein